MKYIWTSIRKKKNAFLFLSMLFLCGLCFGCTLYPKLANSFIDKAQFTTYLQTTTFSFFNQHFFFFLFFFVTSFLGIGILFFLFYFFMEGVGVGLCFRIFIQFYAWKGFCFFLCFLLIFKLLFFILCYFFFFKWIQCSKYSIDFFQRKKYSKKNDSSLFPSIALLFCLLLGSDAFLAFFGNKIIPGMFFLLS